MAIKKAPKITINGSNKVFGGHVYNVRFSPNFSESAARLVVTLANESGMYNEPKLSARIPYRIKIGTLFEGDFYAVSYREDKGPQGKVLEVSFLDGSFVIDQLFIGLHKRHGIIPSRIQDRQSFSDKNEDDSKDRQEWFNSSPDNPKLAERNKYNHFYLQRDEKNNPTNLIILGQELHPCDRDLDGIIDFEKDGEFEIDGCDPCPSCPEGKYDESLNRKRCEDLECTEIFEVKYNFRTLIEAVKSAFETSNVKISINEETLPDTNDEYYADYDGSLRSVLQEWCADYGYNFYFELNSNKELELNFIDVKNPIDIVLPEDIVNQPIAENIKEKSIEETIHRGCISLFQKEGEIKEYTCERSDVANLKALTLRDLYGNSAATNTFLTDVETSVALIKINKSLRDAYWLYKYYKLINFEAAKKCLYTTYDIDYSTDNGKNPRYPWGGPSLTSNSLDWLKSPDEPSPMDNIPAWQQASKFGIKELGGMKIYAVVYPEGYSYSKEPDDIKSPNQTARHRKLLDVSGGKIYKDIKQLLSEDDQKFFEKYTYKYKNRLSLATPENQIKEKKGDPFFIIAHVEDEGLENSHKIEETLANEFMGKYFYRKIDLNDKYKLCSGSSGDLKDKKDFSISVNSPDGGGQVYLWGQDEAFKSSPIFNMGHSRGSRVNKLLQDMELRLKQKEIYRKDPLHIFEDEEFEEALVLVERDAKWHPAVEDMANYEKVVDYYEKRGMKPIGFGKDDFVSKWVASILGEIGEDPNIKVFVVYPALMYLDVNSNSSNPLDAKHRTPTKINEIRKGCNSDCSDVSDCFQGEKNPARRNRLLKRFEKLERDGKKGSITWSRLHLEIFGETCVNGECRHIECSSHFGCTNIIVAGGRNYYDKACEAGKCVDMLGLRSNICMRIDLDGLKIYCPSQSCDLNSTQTTTFTDNDTLKDINARSGYDVLLTQKYTQNVVIPKIQNIVQEDISTESDVLNYDINFLEIPLEDIQLMSGNQCRPNNLLIEQAHERFNRDLTYDIAQPFETHTFTVADLELSIDKAVSVRNGLSSLDISIGSSGISTTYTFSNKVSQPIRVNLVRRLIQLNRRRKTNLNLKT